MPLSSQSALQRCNEDPSIVVRTVAHARASHMPILECEPTTNIAHEGTSKACGVRAQQARSPIALSKEILEQVFEKNKGGSSLVATTSVQCPNIGYNEVSSPIMRRVMAATNSRAGSASVLTDGIESQVADRPWRRVTHR